MLRVSQTINAAYYFVISLFNISFIASTTYFVNEVISLWHMVYPIFCSIQFQCKEEFISINKRRGSLIPRLLLNGLDIEIILSTEITGKHSRGGFSYPAYFTAFTVYRPDHIKLGILYLPSLHPSRLISCRFITWWTNHVYLTRGISGRIRRSAPSGT